MKERKKEMLSKVESRLVSVGGLGFGLIVNENVNEQEEKEFKINLDFVKPWFWWSARFETLFPRQKSEILIGKLLIISKPTDKTLEGC